METQKGREREKEAETDREAQRGEKEMDDRAGKKVKDEGGNVER